MQVLECKVLFVPKSRLSVSGMSNKEKDKPHKLDRKAGGIRAIEEQDNDSSSDSLEHLHSILQLGTKPENFLINVKINGISTEMEIDSEAERSTISLSLFKLEVHQ